MDVNAATLKDLMRYWPAALMLSVLVLLPFARLAGVPMGIMALIGAVALVRHGGDLWRRPSFRLLLWLWLCYAVPLALASLDAVNPARAWTTTAASLRFLLVGVFALRSLADPRQMRVLWLGSAMVVVWWCVDALFQAALGVNLFGMPMSQDRLNGIFGATNIKLGHVLAAVSPLLLEYARRHWRRWTLPACYGLVAAVIILIGTRAAWVMFALVTACYLYLYARHHPGRWLRSLSWVGLLVGVIGVAGYQLSDTLHQRVDRSLLLLSGDSEGVNLALSRRLPIWETALEMAAAHPLNGVGPRGFRYAYPDYAGLDDPWLDPAHGTGAAHAHQLLLEVATETGLFGLIGLVAAVLIAWIHWRHWPPAVRRAALPFAIGIGAMLFPVNTHLAFYSTFWSLVFWWLTVLYCAQARDG